MSQPVGINEFRRDMKERGFSDDEIFRRWDELTSSRLKGPRSMTLAPPSRRETRLEDDFPGLKSEIGILRKRGFSEDEIMRGISNRAQFLKESGSSGEAIDAYLKGRPGPLSMSLIDDKGRMRMPMPGEVKDIQTFIKNTTVSSEEYSSVMNRFNKARNWGAPPLPPGGFLEGTLRGMADSAFRMGKTTWDEFWAGGDQYVEGFRQLVSPESSL